VIINLYNDHLLRLLIVAEVDGQLWLIPRRPGGWASRQALQMTQEARSQRLKVALDVDPAWLGISAEEGHVAGPQTSAEASTRPVIPPAAGCVKRASRRHFRKGT